MENRGFPGDPHKKWKAQTLEEGKDFATIKPGEEGTTEFEKRADFESALKSALGGIESRASKMLAAGADFFPQSAEAAELFEKARAIRAGMDKNLNVTGTKIKSVQNIRRTKVRHDLQDLDGIRKQILVSILNPQFVREQLREAVKGVKADDKIDRFEAERMVRSLTFAASQRIEKEASTAVDAILRDGAGVGSRTDIEALVVDEKKTGY